MDDKRVIDLAHECELFDGQHYGSLWADRIRLFAVAIEVEAEQREREACALVAEKMLRHYTSAVTGVAEAIRKRGDQ